MRFRHRIIAVAVVVAAAAGAGMVTAGPALAGCDLAQVGRSGIAPSGTTVNVDGHLILCNGTSWIG